MDQSHPESKIATTTTATAITGRLLEVPIIMIHPRATILQRFEEIHCLSLASSAAPRGRPLGQATVRQ